MKLYFATSRYITDEYQQTGDPVELKVERTPTKDSDDFSLFTGVGLCLNFDLEFATELHDQLATLLGKETAFGPQVDPATVAGPFLGSRGEQDDPALLTWPLTPIRSDDSLK